MKRSASMLALASVLVLALGLTNVSAQTKELYHLKGQTITSLTDILIAQLNGYFEENGIVYEDVGVIQTPQVAAALLKGQIDFGLFHPDRLALARLAGAKLIAVGPGMIDSPKYPHLIYFTKEGSPIKSAKDCIGKKIGVGFTGSCPDGIFLDWLNQNGVPLDKVEFVVLNEAGGQIYQSLKQGLVDIGGLHPSTYKAAQNAGGITKLIDTYSIVKNPNGGTSFSLTVAEKWAKDNPKIVTGMIAAVNKAHDWMDAHRDEAIKKAAAYLKIPEADVTFFDYDNQKLITDERITPWFERMIRLGLLKPGQIKESEIYTNIYNPEYKGKS